MLHLAESSQSLAEVLDKLSPFLLLCRPRGARDTGVPSIETARRERARHLRDDEHGNRWDRELSETFLVARLRLPEIARGLRHRAHTPFSMHTTFSAVFAVERVGVPLASWVTS